MNAPSEAPKELFIRGDKFYSHKFTKPMDLFSVQPPMDFRPIKYLLASEHEAEIRARDYIINDYEHQIEGFTECGKELLEQIATLQASNEAMSDGFKAAKAFIDCHVADPDITNEMRLAYAHYKECCAAIQNQSELGNE